MKLPSYVFILAITLQLSAMVEVGRAIQCYHSRLDVVNCNNRRITQPRENEFGVYSTRFGIGSRGNPTCRIIRSSQSIRPLPQIANYKLLYSPGIDVFPRINYSNHLLVDYNISCEAGQRALFGVISQDIEPKNCFDPSLQTNRCRDYIQVSGSGSILETCGNSTTTSSFYIPSGKARVQFRTSDTGRYPGFRAYVVCYRPLTGFHLPSVSQTLPVELSEARSRPQGNTYTTGTGFSNIGPFDFGCSVPTGRNVAPTADVVQKARQVGVIRAEELQIVEELASSLFTRIFPPTGNPAVLRPDLPPTQPIAIPLSSLSSRPGNSHSRLQPIIVGQEPEAFRRRLIGRGNIRPSTVLRPLQYRIPGRVPGVNNAMINKAMRFQQACNPILKAATNSYLQYESIINIPQTNVRPLPRAIDIVPWEGPRTLPGLSDRDQLGPPQRLRPAPLPIRVVY